MKTKSIKIGEINIHGGTQQRELINPDIVAEYAEAMRCGAKFPAIILFYDGAQYWLADGFHRFHAGKEAEFLDMLCDVYDGTQRDALYYSAGANSAHGLRPNVTDKRKSVMVLLDDAEWSKLSDRDIAKHCRVSQPFVSGLRKKQAGNEVITLSLEKPKPAPVADVAFSNSPENTELSTDDSNYNPAEDELSEAHETVITLSDENTALRDAIATGSLPPDDIKAAADIIAELRAQVRTLEINLAAVTVSRDGLMRENHSLMEQCKINQRELKKLRK